MIEVPFPRKKKLKKAADVAAPKAIPAMAVNVANFLANQRKQVPPPSMPPMVEVEAFLANEPMEAIPVNVVEPVKEEPIQAPSGPIPSIRCRRLCSNIQHILEEIDMELKESVGMGEDNMGPSTAAVAKTPPETLVSNSKSKGKFSGSDSKAASYFNSR